MGAEPPRSTTPGTPLSHVSHVSHVSHGCVTCDTCEDPSGEGRGTGPDTYVSILGCGSVDTVVGGHREARGGAGSMPAPPRAGVGSGLATPGNGVHTSRYAGARWRPCPGAGPHSSTPLPPASADASSFGPMFTLTSP